MSAAEVLVVLGAAAAIAWVNWYFFVAGRGAASAALATTKGGRQEVEIQVEGGYAPSHVRVKRGTPARLVFDRRETSSCSEEVVLPDFGIRRFLPAHEKTAVEFVPETPGTYEFTCGMGMLRGRITVEDA